MIFKVTFTQYVSGSQDIEEYYEADSQEAAERLFEEVFPSRRIVVSKDLSVDSEVDIDWVEVAALP